ncbi:MAG: DNA glycosylase [Streptosporangiales bacterium]|nr:DNA glycosylase [Streptosporangiales bacterium]
MPEGDTVWLSARRMHDAFAGRGLVRSDFRVPRHATADLTGRTVEEVLARGKHMLTRVEGDVTLHTHFRMDGSWHLHPPGTRWRRPGHQARIVLANEEWEAVGFSLHDVRLVRRSAEERLVGHLGPDLLGPDWDLAEAVRRLRAAPHRDVGLALLDQRNLAGIGNLYRTEVLFLHGTSPWTSVGDVVDLDRLVSRARDLLLLNRDDWPQVTTGDSRRGQHHWVFERAGRPCRRCGATIRTARQGNAPDDRVTYWCPSCQQGPAATNRS